jgi:hypothetical protein
MRLNDGLLARILRYETASETAITIGSPLLQPKAFLYQALQTWLVDKVVGQSRMLSPRE